jgi:hypothetical protein
MTMNTGGNTGAGNTGAGNTGAGNTGAGNTGSRNTGSRNTGYADISPTTGASTVGGSQPAGYASDPRYDVDIVHDEAVTRRRDRIRWSAIWAGLAVAVATYLLLQVLLIAVGVVEFGGSDNNDAVASAIAALVAFFLGGVTAGASAIWRDSDDGLLHGIVLWAAALVVVALLAGIGGGVALGSFDTSQAFDDVTSAQGEAVEEANDRAQDAAGRATAGLVAALVAASVGGLAGSKLWPRREHERQTVSTASTRR